LGAEVVAADGDGAHHRATKPAALERWLAERGGCAAILRPDRYVHAVTENLDEAADALREVCSLAGAVA
jgi:hypothetical protein